MHKLTESIIIEDIQQLASAKLLNPDHIGIGDDCAVIPVDDNYANIYTTDSLIENTHFYRQQISATQLAYKAIAVNMSDIVAMGGTPQYCLLSLGLPKNIDQLWYQAFIHSLDKTLSRYGTQLIGGDTVHAEKITISVTMIGQCQRSKIKYRHNGKPGNMICVTGNLGNAALGFYLLQQNLQHKSYYQQFIHQHFQPTPQIAQGQWLADQTAVTTMMDISDGLDQDLHKILHASHCGAMINLDTLPLSSEYINACQDLEIHPYEAAVIGGEDYRLLITIINNAYPKLATSFKQLFGTELTAIGKLTDSPGLNYQFRGIPYNLSMQNFQHF